MGRIAGAVGAHFLRGCVGCAVSTVYVLVVFFALILLPLTRFASTPGAPWQGLVIPLGLGAFFLLIGPSMLLAFAVKKRNSGYDAVFGSLGLAGFPYALQFRRYDGTIGGRRFQALLSRGPLLVLEAGANVPTRFGITAGAGDTAFFAGLAGKKPILFAVPAYEGLLVFGEDEAWVRRLLAQPGVPALLDRLLRFPGPFARRQLVLRPGALAATYHLSTSMYRIGLNAAQARDWSDALVELAGIAESLPAPERPLAPTAMELRIDAIRRMGPHVNPGVALLVAIAATPLAIGALTGAILLAQKRCGPFTGPGSRTEGSRVVGDVVMVAQRLQVAELRPLDVLFNLGVVERDEPGALHAKAHIPAGARIVVSKDPASGAGREMEWVFDTPPGIRMSTIEERIGKLEISPAPDDPKAVVGVTTTKPREGARWPVRVRVRFEGKAGGPISRIAVVQDPLPAAAAGTPAATDAPGPAPGSSDPAGSAPVPACPVTFDMAGNMEVGESRSCVCVYASPGLSVVGSGRYGPTSWICESAVHAGVLKRPGQVVTFTRQPDCSRLWGSEANGGLSTNWGAPTATYSFTTEPPPCPPEAASGPDVQPCPATLEALTAWPEGQGFDCTCEWSKRERGSVWGRNIYAIHSNVCNAAQQVGAVKRPGGTVTVFLGGGCSWFNGTSSSPNYVRSSRWGESDRTFAFRLPYPPCADGRPPVPFER